MIERFSFIKNGSRFETREIEFVLCFQKSCVFLVTSLPMLKKLKIFDPWSGANPIKQFKPRAGVK